MSILPKPVAFGWDKGNINKNFIKHSVTDKEVEEVFGNKPLKIFKDIKHAEKEQRFVAYGITDLSRSLTVVFTLRGEKIRIISARDQSKKERREYEEKIKTNTKV